MLQSRPLLARFLIWVLAPMSLVALAAGLHVRRSLPVENGVVSISGLANPVRVVRDDAGVAHIYARSDRDAFLALGYVHAQDRLWQMEFQRRMAQGRLSEVLGAPALRTDRLMRTLGLARAAQAAKAHLNEAALDSLRAYAQGVNAWLAEERVLPLEFALLGFVPERWRPEDSLAQVKLMALNLGANLRDEIELDMLVRELGPQRANELQGGAAPLEPALDGGDVRTAAIAPRLARALLDLDAELERHFQFGARAAGSNAWVVSGAHTASGRPLLANDPHLGLQMPSQWYLAEIHGGVLHVTGATMPGLPCVIFGHNERIAWGGTAMEADVQDLYVERLNPRSDSQYEYEGRWEEMSIVEEELHVRADFPAALRDAIPPVKLRVRRTRHGPLLSDALEYSEFPVALRWAAAASDDTSYQSFLALNYADSWQAFNAALAHHVAPALNFVYADRDGNIGLVAAGRIPMRKAGDGRLPVAGWDDRYEWQGFIPFDELPRVFNPESGILVTANDKNHADDYPHLISTSWAPSYRADRIGAAIRELIDEEGRALTAQDFVRLQGDVLDTQSQELLPFLLRAQPRDERQSAALRILAQWDGRSDMTSSAAAIYQAWLRHYRRELIEDDLGGDLLSARRSDELQSLLETVSPVFLKRVAQGSLAGWCDDSTTRLREDCSTAALAALDAALDELERIAGAHMTEWQWGELHHAALSHTAFAKTPLIDLVFNRDAPSGGNEFTVNVAPAEFSEGKGYRQYFGATYRQVIDLADWTQSTFITNTGQSGNPASRHYDDLISRHRKLEMLPMHFSERPPTGLLLTLEPVLASE